MTEVASAALEVIIRWRVWEQTGDDPAFDEVTKAVAALEAALKKAMGA